MPKHRCAGWLPAPPLRNGGESGGAVEECFENENGQLWVSNGEYCSQVNYCPYCGFKAPRQVDKEKCGVMEMEGNW